MCSYLVLFGFHRDNHITLLNLHEKILCNKTVTMSYEFVLWDLLAKSGHENLEFGTALEDMLF